jgi:hypothetical protein
MRVSTLDTKRQNTLARVSPTRFFGSLFRLRARTHLGDAKELQQRRKVGSGSQPGNGHRESLRLLKTVVQGQAYRSIFRVVTASITAADAKRARAEGGEPYPHMRRWLRESGEPPA